VIAGGVIALGLTVILMREGVMWWHSPPGTALPAQEQLHYNLGETLHLIGSDLSARELRPGETLELALYWYASEPVPYQYQTFVHITSGGPPLAQADRINPAGRPTTTWTADGYVRDDYQIALPETMPPGEYQLLVGLYTCETLPPGDCGNGDRLPVRDADGNDLGDAVPLGTILVR
jgi:hypothetical protein